MKAIHNILFLLFAYTSYAQVSETVDFNHYVSPTNNEYTSYFHDRRADRPAGFTPIPDSGIADGCIRTPDTSVGGEAEFCGTYKSSIGAALTTGISFKWIGANTSFYGTAVGINLRCSSCSVGNIFGADISVTTPGGGNPMTLGTSWFDTSATVTGANSVSITLTTGHWYSMVLSITSYTTPTGTDMPNIVKVYDLGSSGTSSPTLVASVNNDYYTYAFATDTAISVCIYGNARAGSRYFDNFTFDGPAGASTCVASGVANVLKSTAVVLSAPAPNPCDNFLNITYTLPAGVNEGSVNIFNTNGQRVYSAIVDKNNTGASINISSLPAGIYYYNLETQAGISGVRKLAVMK